MESQSYIVGNDRSREDAVALTRGLRARRHAIELPRRDLSAYRAGNAGVDYVFSFDSGRAGTHVVIKGLTHGNEPCGVEAVTARRARFRLCPHRRTSGRNAMKRRTFLAAGLNAAGATLAAPAIAQNPTTRITYW